MTTAMKSIFVNVKACCDKSMLEDDDVDVEGVYEVHVPQDCQAEQLASIALDVFHESVAISVLDDFVIDVFDGQTGCMLIEGENNDSYTLGKEGDFAGKIHDEPMSCFKAMHQDADHVFHVFANDIATAKSQVHAVAGCLGISAKSLRVKQCG